MFSNNVLLRETVWSFKEKQRHIHKRGVNTLKSLRLTIDNNDKEYPGDYFHSTDFRL